MFLTDMRISTTLFLMAILTSMCPAAEKGQSLPPPTIDPATGLPIKETEPEKRFDLDFAGGVPQYFVQAVEKAAKMPLNVIIPEEHTGFNLPSLKLRNVTVAQLFDALTSASVKSETRLMGNTYQHVITRYGFRSVDSRPNASSIWFFYVEDPGPYPLPPTPPATCRFWQLEPYLEKLKVEDITTAIETGWKMQGVKPLPKLSFHKDTKLLIACGQREQLTTVDDVLRELTSAKKGLKDSSGQSAPAIGEKSSKQ